MNATISNRAEPRDATLEILCFEVNGMPFCLPTNQVQEINRASEIWPVPHAPPEVQGLINLRGKVVTVLNVRRALGMPPAEQTAGSRNIIVNSSGELLALRVDRIVDTMSISADDVHPAPKESATVDRQLIEGVYCHNSQLISLLDLDALLVAT